MWRIGVGVALVVTLAWFLFGRGDDADAVTSCIRKTGATVEKSPHFAQLFPYAMALSEGDRVKSYSELEGGKVYAVHYGSNSALLFLGRSEDAAQAFESTLTSFAASGGATLPTRRAGKVLLVWAEPTVAPSVDSCIRS